VRALLLARHVDDLPSRATLDHHPGAEQSLHRLARTDVKLVVRARALQLLGLYPTRESEAILVQVAQDAGQPEKLRAAALHGLGGYDLSARADLREIVLAQLDSPDAMVAVAAVVALRDVPAAAAALERIAGDAAAPSPAREMAREVIEAR
jgi:hypothetical protein